ncbi:MAG: fused MFS/spermidine synthase [Planctomycetes bacterium]|nr:fused MFS/spermidine synthase [Planctomycetota bacterium]
MRTGIVFALLLVPTAMMGATLPALAAGVSRVSRELERHVSWLYGLNTLGAMTGSLVSGLFLLGLFGEKTTITVAAAINLFVGFWAVCRRQVLEKSDGSARGVLAHGAARLAYDAGASPRLAPVVRWLVLLSFACSGLASLGFEVIWSRQLVLFMGTSIYAFSTMLVLFLGGLGLGSLIAGQGRDADTQVLPVVSVLQCLLGSVGIVGQCWMAWMRPANPREIDGLLNSLGPGLVIFLFALVSGMMFPRVVRAFSWATGRGGYSLGLLYGANTVGCILGTVLTGFVLIPTMGSSRAAVGLGLLNVLAGLAVGVVAGSGVPRASLRLAAPLLAAASLLMAPTAKLAYDVTLLRSAARALGENAELVFHREGAVAATTAISHRSNPMESTLWVNGVGMTHLGTVTKLMAHLPLMAHGHAEQMLVICFGMGTTVRSAACYEDLKVTSVELVPEVYECFGYFHPDGPSLWRQPRLRRVVDDGRNYLLMHPDKFDVITIDPPPPVHSAGTVNLYSREFFELCRARLQPDGLACLWIPPAAKSELMVIMATFGAVFPHTTLWTAPDEPGFYCLGQTALREIDPATVETFLSRAEIQRDVTEYGFHCESAGDLLRLRLLTEDQFQVLIRCYPVMTDDRPYTEFPLWRRLLRPAASKLYRSDDLLRELGRATAKAANAELAPPLRPDHPSYLREAARQVPDLAATRPPHDLGTASP